VLSVFVFATVRRGEAWSSGRTLWTEAIASHPSCARAQKTLGDIELSDGRIDEALTRYREAVRILPVYEDAHLGVSMAMIRQGRLAEARQVVEWSLDHFGESASALNVLGYIQQHTEGSDSAMQTFHRAVAVDPTFAQAYANIARLHVAGGRIERAVELYRTALAHDPALLPALENLAVLYRHVLSMPDEAELLEREADRVRHSR
jgi:lipopolysaccharide biosynthesis regulator YciM